ncbi:MAG: hypothetical protein L0211_10840 [Planctomycetaceae bacterium]|nr:hypothetical protein [Planctomycetaceae bacterium]
MPANLLPPARIFLFMHDDKRFLRKLKRQVKKAGNRKRRRYLKDIDAAADDFEFGRERTDVMNEPRKPRKSPGT